MRDGFIGTGPVSGRAAREYKICDHVGMTCHQVRDEPVGKPDVREIFRCREGIFLQEYFVYFKKKRRSCSGKDPQRRADDRVSARL